MKASTLLLVASIAPTLAHAQTFDVKPGLWEHSIDLKSESGRLEMALELARTQMALLPPAQRQAIEDTLAQQGLKADFVNQTFQNCITEEEAASGTFSFAEDGGCEQTRVENNGATTHISFVCAQGEGELTLTNGTNYTGSSSMSLNFGGLIENATATHSGRWVGESCAALHP
ncbi:MAG: DUF3617 domain-containing protein [Pseudomonadota bacterium]|nr:DUF3617 domain-containing protein [Pseudomonadota bacterium]